MSTGQKIWVAYRQSLGDIIETTLYKSGEPVNEEVVRATKDLPGEDEYTDEEGRTVRTLKEQRVAAVSPSSW